MCFIPLLSGIQHNKHLIFSLSCYGKLTEVYVVVLSQFRFGWRGEGAICGGELG